MTGHAAGLVIVDKLTAAGVSATVDPRSATPPCVLVPPPLLRFDTGCGALATWQLFAIAPGTANLDAWVILDGLLAHAAGLFPIETSEFVSYTLSPDNPAFPAYRITFTEGIDYE